MRCVQHLALMVSLGGVPAFAQGAWHENAFFGFDLVLTPLAVKWACGGAQEADVAKLDALIKAFPKDAADADLPETISLLREVAVKENGLSQIMGHISTPAKRHAICEVALPLNIDWATPEALANGDDSTQSPAQAQAWAAFFERVEALYRQ